MTRKLTLLRHEPSPFLASDLQWHHFLHTVKIDYPFSILSLYFRCNRIVWARIYSKELHSSKNLRGISVKKAQKYISKQIV